MSTLYLTYIFSRTSPPGTPNVHVKATPTHSEPIHFRVSEPTSLPPAQKPKEVRVDDDKEQIVHHASAILRPVSPVAALAKNPSQSKTIETGESPTARPRSGSGDSFSMLPRQKSPKPENLPRYMMPKSKTPGASTITK